MIHNTYELNSLRFLLLAFISSCGILNSSWSLCFGGLLLLTLFLLHRCTGRLVLLVFRLGVDLPQLVLALEGSRESEWWLDEIQREDAHVSVEAVLCHLQGPAAGTRHQLLLLQDEDVVGFLAGLERVKGWDASGYNVFSKLCQVSEKNSTLKTVFFVIN